MGLRRVIRPVDHTCTFNGAGERFSNEPPGVFGGGAGAIGSFRLLSQGGRLELPAKCIGVTVPSDAAVVIETPGAGGYGDPATRTEAHLQEDLASGKFTPEFVAGRYGRSSSEPDQQAESPATAWSLHWLWSALSVGAPVRRHSRTPGGGLRHNWLSPRSCRLAPAGTSYALAIWRGGQRPLSSADALLPRKRP